MSMSLWNEYDAWATNIGDGILGWASPGMKTPPTAVSFLLHLQKNVVFF